MRPHELLESALAACVCISIDRATQKAGTNLPPDWVELEAGKPLHDYHRSDGS
jgi:putative redox protein